jgi:hypothetical protein
MGLDYIGEVEIEHGKSIHGQYIGDVYCKRRLRLIT